jgi:hypothetical protein
MKRRLAALGVVLALTLSMSAVAVAPAYAHDQWGCPHGQACLSEDLNGGGDELRLPWSTTPRNQCYNLPLSWRDRAKSASADYGNNWNLTLYENTNCSDVFWDTLHSPEAYNFQNTRGHLFEDVESILIWQDS